MALLIQNRAAFVAEMAEINRAHAKYERTMDERVARIEAQMAEVIRVLTDHNRSLERLTEAVRDKIGFKG